MDERLAIHIAKTRFREGYNSGDAKEVLSVIGESFANMSADFPSYWGGEARAEFQDRLSRMFSAYQVQLAVIPITVVFEGALAYDYGWHELILTSKTNGTVLRKRERYFETWRRDAEGPWKIEMYFTNADVPETQVFGLAAD